MKKFTSVIVGLALAVTSLSLLTSCETNAGTGALVGAATGAAIGGSSWHNPGGHALAGAAIGAGAGALIGAAIDADQRGYYEGHPGSYYPMGRRVGPGLVRSPYYPHAVVDVRGVPHGALVRDPSTGRPFRKP